MPKYLIYLIVASVVLLVAFNIETMPDYLIFLILVASGVLLAIGGVMVGAWVMFKGKSTVPNEPFIGASKERGAFSINVDDSEEFPGTEEPSKDEKRVLAKTNEFLEKLGRAKEA